MNLYKLRTCTDDDYRPFSTGMSMNKHNTLNTQHIYYLPQHGEDISWTGSVLTPLESGTKLADGLQQVQIVTADVVLSKIDDCGHE